MPTYVYACPRCEHRFEVFHSMSDDKPRRCPRCKARAKRVPAGGAGLLFKGSGFYVTDYRSDSYKSAARREKGDTGKRGGGKSDAGTGGGKPDAGTGKKGGGAKDG